MKVEGRMEKNAEDGILGKQTGREWKRDAEDRILGK